MRAVMIDNYDSFTYNLVQYFQQLGVDVTVHRNDARTVPELLAEPADFYVISPGPSDPDHAGVSLELIRAAAAAKRPLFGVCLGHQAIGQAFGGKVVRAPLPMHGKLSKLRHTGQGVFAGLPQDLEVTRYHSLVVDPATLPATLEVTARTDDGVVMGLRHKDTPIEGVQFHPESVLTTHGLQMLKTFVTCISGVRPQS